MLRKLALTMGLTITCLIASASPAPKQQIQQFINMMNQKHQFKKQELNQLFAQFKPNQTIIKHMNQPYEARPWARYRALFLQQQRIQQGVKFWRQNAATLQQAQQKYGIPANVIVAILGVESMYGRHRGKYSVFNTLATLAFYYPKRSRFFTSELRNYLLLSHEEQFPVMQAKGSYAGAMGMMQFMPSNVRKYAVGDLSKQLFSQDKSAILSIANYLKSHGWHSNQAIALALPNTKIKTSWISSNAKAMLPTQVIQKAGITTPRNIKRASFIQLPKDPTSQLWMVFPNFRTIMAYNPRIPYAMAVFQLSQAIGQQMKRA